MIEQVSPSEKKPSAQGEHARMFRHHQSALFDVGLMPPQPAPKPDQGDDEQ
jgi:hypothetical protein